MEYQELVQQYLALWNELNATQRLNAVQQVMTADASYDDPQMSGQGHAGISDMIGAAQAQLPGLHFRLSERPVEAHHDYLRFSWLLGPDGHCGRYRCGAGARRADGAGDWLY